MSSPPLSPSWSRGRQITGAERWPICLVDLAGEPGFQPVDQRPELLEIKVLSELENSLD